MLEKNQLLARFAAGEASLLNMSAAERLELIAELLGVIEQLSSKLKVFIDRDEKRKEYTRDYQRAHPEQTRINARRSYAKNRTKRLSKVQTRWQSIKADPEKLAEHNRKHCEHMAEKMKDPAFVERKREYHRRYRLRSKFEKEDEPI